MKSLAAIFTIMAFVATATVEAEKCHVVYNDFVFSDCGTFDCDDLVAIGNDFGCQTTLDRDQGLVFYSCPDEPKPEAYCEEGRFADMIDGRADFYNSRFVNDIFERKKPNPKKQQKVPSRN